MSEPIRRKIFVTGIVQGVGFRPFVHWLARRRGVTGLVRNTGLGVEIEIQGTPESVESFIAELPLKAPPLSIIEQIRVESIGVLTNDNIFEIVPSERGGEKFSLISPDTAVCDACLDEMNDPSDRRYRYPFINCTNCGPRYTIILDVPYDRPETTMRGFEMCPDCRREYENPADRRFHAQPNACPVCGPHMELLDMDGKRIAGREAAIEASLKMLREGKILAVKGIGGYHLACFAGDAGAVSRLRSRKFREDKPFAVMTPDIDWARRLCRITPDEERVMCDTRRPIVLCRRLPDAPVAPAVAPGHKFLGLMFPYAPVHHLLLSGAGEPLVMTSGNRSDEPIVFRDGDVRERIGGIADAILTHNRDIHIRCDDTVSRVWRGAEYILRRSRGHAPAPVKLAASVPRPILACGAELKNTFCLVRDEFAFLSHHVGDLDHIETLTSYEEGIRHFERLFHITPEAIAYDLHPEYLATKYALARGDVERKIGVQHHHAHIAACLADNSEPGPVIGVAMDGLGYGPDGVLWGGEWLVGDAGGCVRAAHLKPLPMPGGSFAIRQPWRMAAAALYSILGRDFLDRPTFARWMDADVWAVMQTALDRGINCPMTTSAGRLFDLISAIVTGRREVNYEGQAAIELELAASDAPGRPYGFDVAGGGAHADLGSPAEVLRMPETFVVDFAPTILGVLDDIETGAESAEVASRFHSTVAAAIVNVCGRIAAVCGLRAVALSGGVFQNVRLLDETAAGLERAGFRVLTHRRVPANDGGLSLGQAVVAAGQMKRL